MTALSRLLLGSALGSIALACVAGSASAAEWRPRSTVGAYLAAGHAQSERDLESASAFLAEVLRDDPGETDLLRRAFTVSLAAGIDDQALALAAQFSAIQPDDPLARIALVMEAARDGDWALADERLSGLKGEGIERAIVPLIRTWIATGKGDAAASAKALDDLGAIQGFEGLAGIHKALTLEVQGDLAGAEAAFQSLGDLGRTIRLVQAYVSVEQRLGHPERAQALVDDIQKQGTDNVLFTELAEQLAAGATVAPPVTDAKEGLAEALFYIASIANQDQAATSGDVALIYARFALILRPDFPMAQLLIGDILAGAEQPEGALAAYRAVPPEGAVGWVARLRSTVVLDRLDRSDEALDVITDLVAERPERADAYVRMGDIYRGERKFEAAAVAYDDAARRDPALAESDWSFLYRRAIVLERSDQFERAEADFRKAVELRPDEAYLLNYLGYSLLDRGLKIDEAETLIRKAIAISPDDGAIIDSLGWVYFKRGDFAQAVETLESAISHMTGDATVNDHLGDAYWMVGRFREARFQWERALRAATADEDEKLAETIRGKLAHGLEGTRSEASTD